MDFLEAAVSTTTEGIEIVSGILYGAGLTGLMIEDACDFREFLDNPNREWDYIEDELVKERMDSPTVITFFVSDNPSGMETLTLIRSNLKRLALEEKEFDLGSLEVTVRNVKEEDWANNWKKYFKPFAVGNKIMIKPSWEELPSKTDKKVLNIDPGHIFGTGGHETTQLCIEMIEKVTAEGDRVLDIGCGSGILSIASLLLGASFADAVDIDPNAVEIAYSNAERNGIERESYRVSAGNILEDTVLQKQYGTKGYDVVEANIVADVIIALSELVPSFLKNGGYFITSGIITTRLEDVYGALSENGFEVVSTKTKKDWAAVLSCLRGKEA